MARKSPAYSVSLTGPAAAALERRTGRNGRSGALSSLIERYDSLLERARPELNHKEWMALCDAALNGAWMRGGSWLMIRSLALEIHDAHVFGGLGAKWGIDAQALAERVGAMTDTEKLAIVDTVERFWAAENRGEAGEEALPEKR